jgi:multisubunit Na+/H+ antiporter MnhE subunit
VSGSGRSTASNPGLARVADVARAWVTWWALCAALWLALVDRTDLAELVLGAVVAVIAATGAVLVRQHRARRVRPQVRWALDVPCALVGLVTDLPLLLRVLWRRGIRRDSSCGVIVESPLDAGPREDRDAAGRRVGAQLIGTLAPSSVVIDVDVDRDVVIEHRLEGS